MFFCLDGKTILSKMSMFKRDLYIISNRIKDKVDLKPEAALVKCHRGALGLCDHTQRKPQCAETELNPARKTKVTPSRQTIEPFKYCDKLGHNQSSHSLLLQPGVTALIGS